MSDSSKPLDDLQNSIVSKSEELMRRKAITYTALEEIYVKHGFSESNGAQNLINKVKNSDGLVAVNLNELDKELSRVLLTHLKFNDKTFNIYHIRDVNYLNKIYDQLKKNSLDECELDLGMGNKKSKEHPSELQTNVNIVCRLLLKKKKKKIVWMSLNLIW